MLAQSKIVHIAPVKRDYGMLWLFVLQFFAILVYAFWTVPDAAAIAAFDQFSFFFLQIFVLIGFGFIATYLAKYWFGAIGYTFYLLAFTFQWAIIFQGFITKVIAGADLH